MASSGESYLFSPGINYLLKAELWWTAWLVNWKQLEDWQMFNSAAEFKGLGLNLRWFCPSTAIWQCVGTFLVVITGGGGCYWYLVGGDQGCCCTRVSPPHHKGKCL